jgi:hypothetical protein
VHLICQYPTSCIQVPVSHEVSATYCRQKTKAKFGTEKVLAIMFKGRFLDGVERKAFQYSGTIVHYSIYCDSHGALAVLPGDDTGTGSPENVKIRQS